MFFNSVFALLNPSAVYCKALGYEYISKPTENGVRGYCKLPNGQLVSAWKFLQGEVAQEFGYCAKQGYKTKTIYNKDVCLRFRTDFCAVCVLENGKEVEVTELMNLSFEETWCGDNACSDPENYLTCPEDCPSGSDDGYCDGIKDNKCDPDCEKNKDPDCKNTIEIPIIVQIIIIGIIIIGVLIFVFLRKD